MSVSLRKRGLLALVVAETISTTGTSMTWLALPWYVLSTTHSAAMSSVTLAADMLPVALLGIPSGALAARVGPRRTMLTCDAGRTVLVALIPLLDAVGVLSFPLLLVLVFAIGSLFAPHYASQRAILPDLVGEDDATVASANALLQVTLRIANLLGPALAGVLISIVGVRTVLALDALTYLASFLLLTTLLPRSEAAAVPPDSTTILAGARFLFSQPLLKVWTLTVAAFELTWQATFAAIPILTFARYGSDPAIAGWLLSSFAIGSVAGNAMTIRLSRIVRPLRLIFLAKIPQAAAFWVLALELQPIWFGATLLFAGLCSGFLEAPTYAVQTMRTPTHLRSHVTTTFVTVALIAGFAGLAGAGIAIEAAGARRFFVAIAVIQTVGTIFFAEATLRADRAETSSHASG